MRIRNICLFMQVSFHLDVFSFPLNKKVYAISGEYTNSFYCEIMTDKKIANVNYQKKVTLKDVKVQ